MTFFFYRSIKFPGKKFLATVQTIGRYDIWVRTRNGNGAISVGGVGGGMRTKGLWYTL